MWQSLQDIDRRVIYVVLMAVCVCAVLRPVGLPISISPSTRTCHRYIQDLHEGDTVYISMEFGAYSAPELLPTLKSTVKMVFERGARIVTSSMWQDAPGLCRPVIDEIAGQLGRSYGTDYVNLGYRPGGQVFLERAMADLSSAVAGVDERGISLGDLPLMRDFNSIADAKLLYVFSAGEPGMQAHIKIVGDRTKIPVCCACVATMVPEALSYVRSGQLAGILAGMRRCAAGSLHDSDCSWRVLWQYGNGQGVSVAGAPAVPAWRLVGGAALDLSRPRSERTRSTGRGCCGRICLAFIRRSAVARS